MNYRFTGIVAPLVAGAAQAGAPGKVQTHCFVRCLPGKEAIAFMNR
jgi:hypothetical protein